MEGAGQQESPRNDERPSPRLITKRSCGRSIASKWPPEMRSSPRGLEGILPTRGDAGHASTTSTNGSATAYERIQLQHWKRGKGHLPRTARSRSLERRGRAGWQATPGAGGKTRAWQHPHRPSPSATSTSWASPGSPRGLNRPNRPCGARMPGGVAGDPEGLPGGPFADSLLLLVGLRLLVVLGLVGGSLVVLRLVLGLVLGGLALSAPSAPCPWACRRQPCRPSALSLGLSVRLLVFFLSGSLSLEAGGAGAAASGEYSGASRLMVIVRVVEFHAPGYGFAVLVVELQQQSCTRRCAGYRARTASTA